MFKYRVDLRSSDGSMEEFYRELGAAVYSCFKFLIEEGLSGSSVSITIL